jgi:uncharacterized membrane protein YphA (DoxX/SURF4 family)
VRESFLVHHRYCLKGAVAQSKRLDLLALLAIRFYLIPVIYVGPIRRWWALPVFGASGSERGLNLPFPTLLAFLAVGTEVPGWPFLTIAMSMDRQWPQPWQGLR